MIFKYYWQNKEANFGEPISTEISGGTHLSCELVLKYQGKYVALRRPAAIPEHEIPRKAKSLPNGALYFVHGLPRWGENMTIYIKRVLKDQTGVGLKEYRVVDLEMDVYLDTNQWVITPDLIVEIDRLPTTGVYGNQITEVITFTKDHIPEDFGWWSKQELEEFLKKFD